MKTILSLVASHSFVSVNRIHNLILEIIIFGLCANAAFGMNARRTEMPDNVRKIVVNALAKVDRDEFKKLIGDALPEALDSLDALQTYAAFYAAARNDALFEKANLSNTFRPSTADDPCARVTKVKRDYAYEMPQERLAQIYQKTDQFSDGVSAFHVADANIYFAILPINLTHKKALQIEFKPFLLANNPEILPDARAIMANMLKLVKVLERESYAFANGLKQLSPEKIAKWMRMDGITHEEKGAQLLKIQGIQNDLKRRVNYLQYMMDHWEIMQILDVIHLAETYFDFLSSTPPFVKSILEAGQLFPEMGTSLGESGLVHSRSTIKRFFSHRQYPLRSIYLFDLAMGLVLKDAINSIRMNAGLTPIPEQIFVQPDFLKEAFQIDESLLSIEQVLLEQEKENTAQWLQGTNAYTFEKQKAKEKQRAKATSKRKLRPTKKTCPVPSKSPIKVVDNNQKEHCDANHDDDKIATAVTIEAPVIEIPLGTRVHSLLDQDERKIFEMLFAKKKLRVLEINKLAFGVYRALVDLNRCRLATRFLKKISDTRLYLDTEKHGFISVEALKSRLAIFLMFDIVHPLFEKETMLTDERIREQVLAEKILHSGKSNLSVVDVAQLLRNAETIIANANSQEQRRMLVNLAHSWHRYAQELEMQRSKTAHYELEGINGKIVALLKKARELPISLTSTGVLEAYLMSYYLNVNQTPVHDRLKDADFVHIQKRAYEDLTSTKPLPCFELSTISLNYEELGKETICDSIFHAMTNGAVDDYLVVKFDHAIKDRKLPLFIRFKDKIYRTDVFGGSRLRPNLSEQDYGSVIAVSLRAGEFFQRWFTSEESFWYGQRAFLPRPEENTTKQIHGDMTVQTIPDEKFYTVFGNLLVHDGFGYIRASKAKKLRLYAPMRVPSSSQKQTDNHEYRNVAFQALHGYDSDQNAARDLFNGVCERHKRGLSDHATNDDRANAYRCTVPKLTAVGVPVKGDQIILPKIAYWHDFVHDGTMVGRNPYSARSLQSVHDDGIAFDQLFNDLQVFQYTLTGLTVESDNAISGSFFKGLLAVIDDRDWPWDYAHADIIVSSKDEKLNQRWLVENDKKFDQARDRAIKMRGVLFVTKEMHKKQVAGLPPALTDKLAGDFDGDEYDFLTRTNYEHVGTLVERESALAILNPKIPKSFTKRTHAGNYGRILALRRPILETWNNIINRFYRLPIEKRLILAEEMATSNLLTEWLEEHEWKKYTDALDIVTVEIQVGIKLGEDIFKTTVNSERVMERARAYERALLALDSSPSLPYGSGFKKKLDAGASIKDATRESLTTPKSANLVDKATRAFSRYLNDDETYDGYLSDDDNVGQKK